MSTMDQIKKGVGISGEKDLVVMHCTSTYPCEPEQLDLKMIETLRTGWDYAFRAAVTARCSFISALFGDSMNSYFSAN